jgi:hypothetical protein
MSPILGALRIVRNKDSSALNTASAVRVGIGSLHLNSMQTNINTANVDFICRNYTISLIEISGLTSNWLNLSVKLPGTDIRDTYLFW